MLLHLLLSVSLLAPAPATAVATEVAPAPPPFAVDRAWLHGLWSDGDGLLAVADFGAVHLSCRTGERTSLVGARHMKAVHGAWVDGALVLAAITEDGLLLLWRGGVWSVVPVPGAQPVDVGVDGRGRVVVAGVADGVHRLDGDTWQDMPYPYGMQRAAALAVRDDGSFIVVGAGGQLAHEEPEPPHALRSILVLEVPADPRYAWWSPGGTLWIADADKVVTIDTVRWQRAQIIVPLLFGRHNAITGLSGPDGDLLAVASQSHVALLHGAMITRPVDSVVFPEALAFDVRGGALLVASRDGVTTLPVDHPALRAARARLETRACPLPPGQRTQDLASLRPVPKASPAPPPEAAPRAAPNQPNRSGLTDEAWPTVRLGFGAGFAAGAAGPRNRTGFSLDVAIGATVPVHRLVTLWPELGYAYTTGAQRGAHLFTVGLAPMFGKPMFQVGLAPRLVVGDAWGATGVGLRSGLVVSVLHSLFTIEGGHQWLRVGGRDLHEGRLMISLDLIKGFLVTVLAGAVAGAARRIWR